MRLQKGTRFALHAALELARARGARVTTQEIAARYGISAHHLAKVMGQLVRAGIARAARGAGGGHVMARAPGEVSVLEVIEAIEGPRRRGCSVADVEGAPCPAPCGLRCILDGIVAEAEARLAGVTLAEAAAAPAPRVRRAPRAR